MSPNAPRFTVFTTAGETYSLENETGLRHRLAVEATPKQQAGPVYLLPRVELSDEFLRAHGLAEPRGRVPLERLMDPATLRVLPRFAERVRLEFDEPVLPSGCSRPVVPSYLREILGRSS